METIRLKCNNCQGTLDIDPNREVLSCPYCGEKTLVPESDEVKIEKIKGDTLKSIEKIKQKNTKVIAISIVIVLGALIFVVTKATDTQLIWLIYLIFFVYLIFHKYYMEKNMVKVPLSSLNAKGQNYKTVEQYFRNAGFTNIICSKNRGNILYNYKKGEVKKVTINGTTLYTAGDHYESNSSVVITYYSNEDE